MPDRRLVVLPVALCLLTAAVPPAALAGPGTLDPASIHEQTLPNGLRVIVKESHAANLVSLQYWIRAGVFREDENTAGTAHYLEHLLFKGTETRPQGGLDAEIEDLGGVLEAETDKDWTTFRVTVATSFWQKALGVLADMVQHPRLRLEDVEGERRVILDEIAAGRTEAPRVLMNSLFQYALPDRPYRFPTTGTPENVTQMKVGPVRDYFRRYYTPANSILIAVGDVTPEAVLQQARSLFPMERPPTADQGSRRALARAAASDSGGTRPTTIDPPPSPVGGRVTRPNRDARAVEPGGQESRRHEIPSPFRGAYYGVAFPAPGIKDLPDVYAMDILVTMLEQGPTGWLPALLREKARSVKADYQTLREPGLLTVMVGTSPDRLEEVEKAVLEEIGRLRAGPPPAADVAATRSILAGSYALDNETFAAQGKTLGYYAMIDRWQFASSYLENIGKVSPEQVHAAAIKYLVPEQATTVILRPRSGGEQ